MDQLPMDQALPNDFCPAMPGLQQHVGCSRIHQKIDATSHRYPSHQDKLWQCLHGVKTVKDLKDLETLYRDLKTYKVL